MIHDIRRDAGTNPNQVDTTTYLRIPTVLKIILETFEFREEKNALQVSK